MKRKSTKSIKQQTQITKNILSMVERVKKENWKGPVDLATNHNHYFMKTCSNDGKKQSPYPKT